MPAIAATFGRLGQVSGWAPHAPELRRRRADTSALVFILVAILAPNAFVSDAIGTTSFAIFGGACIWALVMAFPPSIVTRSRQATAQPPTPAPPGANPHSPAPLSTRIRRGPVSVGLIATAVIVAGSPSSMATEPAFAAAVAVVIGAGFFTLAATIQLLASSRATPAVAPPRQMWPRAAQAGEQRGRAAWSAPSTLADHSISLVVQRYTGLLYSTERADRPKAEDAIGTLYRDAGADPPPCVWVRSPREALLARAVLRAFPRSIADPVMDPPQGWQVVREARPAEISSFDWDEVIDGLEASLVLAPTNPGVFVRDFSSELWDAPDLSGLVISNLGQGALRVLQGSNSIKTVANVQEAAITYVLREEAAFGEVAADHPTGLPQSINSLVAAEQMHALRKQMVPTLRTAALIALLESCGGWWPTPLAVVLTERPVVANRDGGGRLHSTDGPALEYADGWRVYANHGTAIPREAFEQPDTISLSSIRAEQNEGRRAWLISTFGSTRYLDAVAASLELIQAEPNVRIRRTAIDRYGVARFVQETGTVIDSDLDGQGQQRRLWRATRAGDESIVLVEVLNSTPEADGSRHHYWLRVPPQVNRCQDAVAWTFGVSAAAYHPAFES